MRQVGLALLLPLLPLLGACCECCEWCGSCGHCLGRPCRTSSMASCGGRRHWIPQPCGTPLGHQQQDVLERLDLMHMLGALAGLGSWRWLLALCTLPLPVLLLLLLLLLAVLLLRALLLLLASTPVLLLSLKCRLQPSVGPANASQQSLVTAPQGLRG